MRDEVLIYIIICYLVMKIEKRAGAKNLSYKKPKFHKSKLVVLAVVVLFGAMFWTIHNKLNKIYNSFNPNATFTIQDLKPKN